MNRTYFFLFVFLYLSLSTAFSQEHTVTEKELAVNEWINGSYFSPSGHYDKIILLIAGSGPTDRYGNQPSLNNNSLKMLSENLCAEGLGVFSYDKRILSPKAKNELKEEDLRFETLVDDAADIIQFLKDRYPGKMIYVAGHSEGSLIGMLAARKQGVSGFISLAGVADGADMILREQIAKQAPMLSAATDSILLRLTSGQPADVSNPMLQSLFRPSVQNYLISWFRYKPVEILSDFKIPVLIVQGGKDIQVSKEQGEKLHDALSSSEYRFIPDMNHVLKQIEGNDIENHMSYMNPSKALHPSLVPAILAFLKP